MNVCPHLTGKGADTWRLGAAPGRGRGGTQTAEKTGRGAHITTRLDGERVKLIGRARTVIEGQFFA